MSPSENDAIRPLLDAASIHWRMLTESERIAAEMEWRAVFGKAFQGRPRVQRGIKAELAYERQPPAKWFVVPLSSAVAGTPVTATAPRANGYLCEGSPVPLGNVCSIEIVIFSADLSWTMLHTHEDHGHDGPYFMRREWIV